MNQSAFPLSLPFPERETASRLAFTWLLHLRWGAVACQVLLILAARLFFALDLPLAVILPVIGFGILSNCLFYRFRESIFIPGRLVTLVIFLDVALLTILLAFAGGPMNPFTFLYLIHIVIGAILLASMWSWILAGYTVLCYAAVFFLPAGGTVSPSPHGDLSGQVPRLVCPDTGAFTLDFSQFGIHLQGMWIAFAITAFFVIFFIGRIQRALARHQETITRLKEEKIKSEKLASLATLSAGAAHELSTPLATIAVAAGEMLYSLQQKTADTELREDALLIRSQVEKCKEILAQMAADAGEPLGETEQQYPVAELLEQTLAWSSPEVRSRIVMVNETGDLDIRIPPATLSRILKGLLTNALDAVIDNSPVIMRCRRDARNLYFEVVDQGQGMDSQILTRATEPFFTTKKPGKGMGLGLFLARSVAERLGGELSLTSAPGAGTTVVLSLPLHLIGGICEDYPGRGSR